MIHYIIKVYTEWENKDGSKHSMTSYFEKISCVVVPMCHLVGEREKEKAKKFDCKSEAQRFIRRTWGNKKGYSVEKVITERV